MTFKPSPSTPKKVQPKSWQRLVVNLQSDERPLRNRIETAAQESRLTVSQFCRQAIKYAIDNMET